MKQIKACSINFSSEKKLLKREVVNGNNFIYGRMVDIMMELSERIIEVLEAHDISLCGEITERTYNNDGYDVELETYSPEGEDVIISLIYDGTEEDFIRQFESYAEGFDAEEHAETYINMRGQNGVPESIKDLLEDAEWQKEMLLEVAKNLKNIDNEEEDTKELKTYKCTISITDGEQTEEQDFYVEAKSFEEAVENIQNDLDISF